MSSVPLPPVHLRPGGRYFLSDHDFVASGRREATRLINEAKLSGDKKLLDFGCGVGRLAVGLLDLGAEVKAYHGFDTNARVIEWCKAALERQDPKFQFDHIDMFNARYNPHGPIRPIVGSVDLPDGTFDMAYACSVFSHLTWYDATLYFRELARLTRRQATFVLTAFVEDDVPDYEVNPKGYGDLSWEGELHCVRYRRAFFELLAEEAGFEVEDFEYGREYDGQSRYVMRRSGTSARVGWSRDDTHPSLHEGEARQAWLIEALRMREQEAVSARMRLREERKLGEKTRGGLDEANAEILRAEKRIEKLDTQLAQKSEELKAVEEEAEFANARRARIAETESLVADLQNENRALKKRERSLASSLYSAVAVQRAEQAKRRQLRDQFERLKRRRSVKLALAGAKVMRPAFRAVRRGRRRAQHRAERKATSEQVTKGGVPSNPQAGAPLGPTGDVRPSEVCGRDVSETTRSIFEWGTPVTIIVPIYNRYEELTACVDAIVRNTMYPAHLVLVDDASTDGRVADFLDEIERRLQVEVIRKRENEGFSKTVSLGLSKAKGDVVLLNSDTEVTPRWLTRIRRAAYSSKNVGTVTPLSDQAGVFSLDFGESLEGVSKDELGRAVARASKFRYPHTPTGHGFCLYVKRDLLDEIGGLDCRAFPQGYGEEVDLCLRASRSGWRHIVDDATIVFHQNAASYGESRKAELVAHSRSVIDERYPEYSGLLEAFKQSEALADVKRTLQEGAVAEIERSPFRVRPRVLFVIHDGGGGTPRTNLDLIKSLAPDREAFVLKSDSSRLEVYRHDNAGQFVLIESEELRPGLEFGEFANTQYRSFVSRILLNYDIELVHVRHLLKHTFDVGTLARALHVPLVLSLHDYYLVCPSVHLVDNQGQFCGGRCTAGHGRCHLPARWVDQSVPLKHEWVHYWRENTGELMRCADALVTTSRAARDVYVQAFDGVSSDRIDVIPHGRDFARTGSLGARPRDGETIRLLVPGNVGLHKGAGVIRRLKEIDRDDRLEFHFVGRTRRLEEELGVCHGPYEREQFYDLVEAIRPSFVALFSIWGETYSHTLTEAWAVGVPVLASKLGALEERITEHGGGWLVDPHDEEKLYELIVNIADDPEEYDRVQAEANLAGVASVGEMGEAYLKLYERLGRQHGALRGPVSEMPR